MRRLLTAIVLLAVVAVTPRVFAWQADGPTGPAPQIVTARVDDQGRIEIAEVVVRWVAEERVRTVRDPGGRTREERYTVSRPVFVTQMRQMDRQQVRVFGTDGRPVDWPTVTARLKMPTPVLLAATSKAVDPVYLKVIREGTLILIPQSSAPRSVAPPVPVAPPPPPAPR